MTTSTSSSSAPGSPASARRTTCGAVPRPELRRPGRPGRPGRHLVDPPLPGRALRQRPVHLRLPVQAVARPVDRRGRGDPRLPRRGHRGGRPGGRTSATSTGSPRPAGRPRSAGGPSRSPGPTPASSCGSPPTSCGCARATTTTPSPTAAVGGHGPVPGRGRAPAAVARDLDLTGKRVVVIGSGATAATLIPAIAKRRPRT
jgi:hypothetical protein